MSWFEQRVRVARSEELTVLRQRRLAKAWLTVAGYGVPVLVSVVVFSIHAYMCVLFPGVTGAVQCITYG